MALFTYTDGTTKNVDFGSKGSNYTINKDPERQRLYFIRHQARENWEDPETRGALSRWILWNKPNLEDAIKDYKKRFNLK